MRTCLYFDGHTMRVCPVESNVSFVSFQHLFNVYFEHLFRVFFFETPIHVGGLPATFAIHDRIFF